MAVSTCIWQILPKEGHIPLNPSVPSTGHFLQVPVWAVLGIQPQHDASCPGSSPPQKSLSSLLCLLPPQGSVPRDRESAAGEVGAPEAAGFPEVGQQCIFSEGAYQTPQVRGSVWDSSLPTCWENIAVETAPSFPLSPMYYLDSRVPPTPLCLVHLHIATSLSSLYLCG